MRLATRILASAVVGWVAVVALSNVSAAQPHQRVALPSGETPLSPEAFEKLKKLALSTGSKVLIAPGVKKVFSLPEAIRVETMQIGVEVEGERHFFAVRVGGGDDVFILVTGAQSAGARAGGVGGGGVGAGMGGAGGLARMNENNAYTYLTNSKLKLRGAALSVKGDQNVHHVVPTDAEPGFARALDIWARVAEGQ